MEFWQGLDDNRVHFWSSIHALKERTIQNRIKSNSLPLTAKRSLYGAYGKSVK
jgi:hypothetical protein